MFKQWIISQNCWYHSRHGEVAESDLISLTKEEYDALMEQYNQRGKKFAVENGQLVVVVADGMLSDEYYAQEQTNIDARQKLAELDWKVIRELERLYLSGTALNAEREALRQSVIDQSNGGNA